MNPRVSHNGLNTSSTIARQLPKESFLIAGSLYYDSFEPTIHELDNVTYLRWYDNKREVYVKTKLLLIPSTYQEGGGCVVIEGFVNGLPAIGIDIGGIPDNLGEWGDIVGNYKDVDAWIPVIEKYTSFEDYYEMIARNERSRSKLLDKNKIVKEFERILETYIDKS